MVRGAQAAGTASRRVARTGRPGPKERRLRRKPFGAGFLLAGQRGFQKNDEESRRSFVYSYTLPEAVEPDKVKANLSHGVLEVRMPASPKLVGKKIPIEIGVGEAPKQLKAA